MDIKPPNFGIGKLPLIAFSTTMSILGRRFFEALQRLWAVVFPLQNVQGDNRFIKVDQIADTTLISWIEQDIENEEAGFWAIVECCEPDGSGRRIYLVSEATKADSGYDGWDFAENGRQEYARNSAEVVSIAGDGEHITPKGTPVWVHVVDVDDTTNVEYWFSYEGTALDGYSCECSSSQSSQSTETTDTTASTSTTSTSSTSSTTTSTTSTSTTETTGSTGTTQTSLSGESSSSSTATTETTDTSATSGTSISTATTATTQTTQTSGTCVGYSGGLTVQVRSYWSGTPPNQVNFIVQRDLRYLDGILCEVGDEYETEIASTGPCAP